MILAGIFVSQKSIATERNSEKVHLPCSSPTRADAVALRWSKTILWWSSCFAELELTGGMGYRAFCSPLVLIKFMQSSSARRINLSTADSGTQPQPALAHCFPTWRTSSNEILTTALRDSSQMLLSYLRHWESWSLKKVSCSKLKGHNSSCARK